MEPPNARCWRSRGPTRAPAAKPGLHAMLADALFEAHQARRSRPRRHGARVSDDPRLARRRESPALARSRRVAVASGETRAKHLAAVLAIRPDESTADALEALLDTAGRRHAALAGSFKSASNVRSRPGTKFSRRTSSRPCVPPTSTKPSSVTTRPTAVALERYLRFVPDALEHRMRLAALHLDLGNLRSALGHWEQAAADLARRRCPHARPRLSASRKIDALRVAAPRPSLGTSASSPSSPATDRRSKPSWPWAWSTSADPWSSAPAPACSSRVSGDEVEVSGWLATRGENRISSGEGRAGLADLRAAAATPKLPERDPERHQHLSLRWLEACEQLANTVDPADEALALALVRGATRGLRLSCASNWPKPCPSRPASAKPSFASLTPMSITQQSLLARWDFATAAGPQPSTPALEHGLSTLDNDAASPRSPPVGAPPSSSIEELTQRCARQVIALASSTRDAAACLTGLEGVARCDRRQW